MGNDILTQNSLYILGSDSPIHRVKGVILRLAKDVDSCKQDYEDIRLKVNDLHNVQAPDTVVIMGIVPDYDSIISGRVPTNITCAFPPSAGGEAPSDKWKGEFGDNYLTHEYIRAFSHLRIDESTFSPRWNRDFRIPENVVDGWRGGYQYRAPAGFMRYGLMVSGRFDNGNDTWLGMSNDPGEWAVAYHGTHPDFVKSITQSPLRPGDHNYYGRGVYCSPQVEEAADYAPSVTIDGANYQYVFMCRVNVSSVHHCQDRPCPEAGNPAFTLHITTTTDYWFVNAENQNYQNIRTYGLLVREQPVE
jgi:hypothetical protein